MRVLFLDSVHEILEQELSLHGYICEHDYTSSYEKLRAKLKEYEGVVIRSRIPLDRSILADSGLKFIARSGSGLENIDLEAAKAFRIQVFSSPEGNKDAVAEHATGMLLMLLNNLRRADVEVRSGIWRRAENRGRELKSKTVGIIGFGHMGSAFAERLSGFGCRILAYDKYKRNYAPEGVEETDLEGIFTSCDVISLHLPLSAETDYFVNAHFIERCLKPFILINTARGRHVQLNALLAGLESGKIEGACLDVLELEKTSFESLQDEGSDTFQRLIQRDDVVLSPHIAGWTHESYVKLSSFLAQKIIMAFG